AEDAARQERLRLGLGDQPIPDLLDVLESQVGLRICYWPLPAGVAGMFANAGEGGYCIMVNRKHPHERRRYSLAHEYAHLLTDRHKPGVDYVTGSARRPPAERFADAFAAAFLMPANGVR